MPMIYQFSSKYILAPDRLMDKLAIGQKIGSMSLYNPPLSSSSFTTSRT
jgi:hypothetical protein